MEIEQENKSKWGVARNFLNLYKQKVVFTVASLVALIGVFFFFRSGAAKEKKQKRELQVAEEAEAQKKSKQQKELERQWAIEKEREYESEVLKRANEIKERLHEIQQKMKENLAEAEANKEEFMQKFNNAKVSYDDDLTSSELEQDMEFAFLSPDEREGKKKAMQQLAQLLKEDAELNKIEYNQLYNELITMDQQYRRMYPERPPLISQS